MLFTGIDTTSKPSSPCGAPSDLEVHTASQIEDMDRAFYRLDAGIVCNRSPVQDLIWSRTCAENLSAGSRLAVVHVRQGDQTVAIAPLYRGHGLLNSFEQLGVRQLLEPMDFIYRDADALDALAARLAQLNMPLFLYRLPGDSLVPAALKRAYHDRASVLSMNGERYPYIDLTGCNIGKLLSPSMRHDIRRARRKADKAGCVSFEVLSPAGKDDFLPLFREFLEVEAASWKGRAGTALAHDARRRGFYELYGIRASEAGILRMCFMRINNMAVAAQIAVESGRRFWLLKIGFDEEYARCSPGTLLINETLRYAFGNGLQSYEFMGAADRWTKRWTKSERNSLVVAVCPYAPGGLLALIGDISCYVWRKMMEKSTRHLRKVYARRT